MERVEEQMVDGKWVKNDYIHKLDKNGNFSVRSDTLGKIKAKRGRLIARMLVSEVEVVIP